MSTDKDTNEGGPKALGDTPEDQHARWTTEFATARKALESWQGSGEEIDKEFRNEGLSEKSAPGAGEFATRLPLFTSDVQTMIAMLFGQVPRATVTRRFADASDAPARVAGELIERIINTDIARDSDTTLQALRCCLMDFFLPGFGQAVVRYVTGDIESTDVPEEKDETGKVLVEGYTDERRPKEDVEVDYVHWKDWLWGPAHVLHEIPWWARRLEMTRAQLVERFKSEGKLVPLQKRKDGTEDPWSRAHVWETYEKATRTVYWFCETHPRILDTKKDPLELEGFYPFPEPLVANLTTSKVVPRPYFALHQDQYRQVNMLMSRIRELVDAVRVSGACDKEVWEHLQRMLSPEGRGRLVGIPNWGKISGNGGLKGAVEFFPLEQTVAAIQVLQAQLVSEIDLLHQSTGWSDIMRGEATQAGATATEQRVKARTGSVRAQRLQDEIARFATDLLKLKAEVAVKRFTPETLMLRANVKFMPEEDQALVPRAIELLKSNFACYRIEVKPEAVALADFAAMKQERGEVMETLTMFFQAMAPLVAQVPTAANGLLKMARWVVAGVRGSSEIQGVFDSMIQQAEQAQKQAAMNPKPAPPDPKLQAEQVKLQGVQMKVEGDLQREQLKGQNRMAELQGEVQADAQREANQTQENIKETFSKTLIQSAFRPRPVPGNGTPTKPGGFP